MTASSVSSRTWQPPESAKALRCWREHQLQAVASVCEGAVLRWATDWGLYGACLEPLACVPASTAEVGNAGCILGQSGGAAAWLLASDQLPARLAVDLFASTCVAGIAGEVAQQCASDLAERTSEALGLLAAEQAPPAPVPGADCVWAGFLVVKLPFGVSVLMNAAAVEAVLRAGDVEVDRAPTPAVRMPPLAGVAAALSHVPLGMHVHLQECEVEFGQLNDLQPGDVLCLDHPLDAPVSVRSTDGAPVFTGFLARSGARKAVELAPLR